MTRRVTILTIAVILCACGGQGSGSQPSESSITVFAAASLQPAFDKIGVRLKTTNNIKTTFNYAGTQTLTAQLQQGAQGDVFASADVAHMTTLQAAGFLSAPSKLFAHNKLEIAVAKGNPKHIQTLADLSPSGLVLVLAEPSVPAGKYAQQALSKAKVSVHPASLELQVTAVLTKVALGEADAGIVYVSDVVTSGKVDGVTIPDEQNVIADYPIAGLKSKANAAGARSFIDFVLAPDGQAILKAAGFQGV